MHLACNVFGLSYAMFSSIQGTIKCQPRGTTGIIIRVSGVRVPSPLLVQPQNDQISSS